MITHILKLIWNKKGQNSLMILEIFLSFLVLYFVLAYVLYNLNIVNKPMGFAVEDKWMIGLDNIALLDSLEGVAIIENLQIELMAQDEIEQVSFAANVVPFSNNQWMTSNDDNGFEITSLVIPVDIHLDEVMDLNVIEGRWFDEADIVNRDDLMIVNKAFMEKYFPEKSMVDSTLIFDGDRKIIGVVNAYRYNGQFSEDEPTALNLRPSVDNREVVLLDMKSAVPAAFEEKLAGIVAQVTKTTGSTIERLDKLQAKNSRESWLMLIAMLTVCGFLCLNVALGLFGVLWYNINKRKSEIGLRQALGAHGSDITKQFILEILILTGIALVIGIFFAIQIPLLKVTEYEPSLFYKSIIYSTLIIMSLVFLCALMPSLQAARITPADSLHED